MAQSAIKPSQLSRQELDLLLEQLKREKGKRQAQGSALGPRPRDGGPLPLSFAQQRLWLLAELDPGSPAYNVSGGLSMRGPLAAAALARGLATIVDRHEALRTTFSTRGGEPVANVAPSLALRLPVIDLSALAVSGTGAGAKAVFAALGEREARRPFDLRRGPTREAPLLRALLVRLGARDHGLLLTLHHIVSDGWSLGVLVHELAALYRHFSPGGCAVHGAPPPLPPLPLQYADFAAWQRDFLTGDVLERQLAYWKKALAGLPPALELPADRPRPAVASLAGRRLPLAVPGSVAAGLAALARQSGATTFMVVLAAYTALLARLTGQRDLVVGSTIANRNRSEVEGLIGFFVNTLALRTRGSGDPTFRELLARVRETTLSAYAQQDLPFEKLVEEVAPARSLSHSPLFQVALDFQADPLAGAALPGLELERVEFDGGTAKFDLLLSLLEGDRGLAGYLEYATDLFDESTARRLARLFGSLLAAVVAAPDTRVSALPLAAAAERHQLLLEWGPAGPSALAGATGCELCLHQLFEDRARRAPEAEALIDRDGVRLTYRELDRRAEALARTLRARGVGPEVRVGVCLERDRGLVVALLAVLKAGGAYVPFDPLPDAGDPRSAPLERLRLIFDDSRMSLLITQESFVDRLPAPGAGVLLVDREGRVVGSHLSSQTVPATRVRADNLAYLIYTSGSTGKPKGVAIAHRSAVALAHWARETWSPGELAGVAATTSICFDLSVFEIFVTLAWGGKVILAANALALSGHPAATEVTLLNTVPSAIAELARQEALPPAAATINLAGEALKRVLVDRLYELPQVAAVWNLYGPSEDTTYSTSHRVPRGERRGPAIGRPVDGTSAYLLDRGGRTAPLGAPGELCLAGIGLARGYHDRPALTAERFVPDPFSAQPGARSYRTGDLARWLPEGQLDYLGRIDHQVKVRGFRIELGEIEAALLSQQRVAEAVVVAREVLPGETSLVAYVVPRGAQGPEQGAGPGNGREILPASEAATALDVQEIRRILCARLPEYMVPAFFVELEALPLNANGKVDRRALPAPRREGGEAAPIAPRTPLEARLARLFADVLGVERVGVEDNFFRLGGHSLSASQLVSRLRDAFDAELPLRLVFEHPTVAALAPALERLGARAAAPGEPAAETAPPLTRRPRTGEPLPLSYAQQRLWLLDRLDPASVAYSIPAGFVIRGPLDVGALAASFAEIVGRHEALRTVFTSEGGRPVARVVPRARLPLPVIDLAAGDAAAAEARADAIARGLARRSFELAVWPLLRWALIRLGDQEHRLVVVMHHIVTDGWSMEVLIHELAALYPGFVAGRLPELPELAIQYADFAAWQREWLAAGAGERQLAYWRGELADLPALELPADRPRPPVQSLAGATHRFLLPGDLTAGLSAFATGRGATLFMALFAGFAALLSRLSGQRGFTVGSPVAGRGRTEAEPLIGFFVNTLVLRADLSGNPSFADLLGRARETAMAAYAHQDLPFEQMVEELAPPRDLSYTPFFQVMLALQNAAGTRLELPGLALSPLPLDTGTAKFDLLLGLAEVDGALAASLEYSTALFDGATVRRWMASFETLLRAALAAPEAPLAAVPWLAAAERQQVLVEWREEGPEVASELCLHQLFERQARERPGEVALVTAEERLIYGELDERAGRLARALAVAGVGPETRVGVCLERNAALVVALLAVHKAGGAYVPFDPLPDAGPPPERLRLIFDDCRMSWLITQESFVDRLPGVGVLLVDSKGAPLHEAGGSRPLARAHPDNLAYLIYTSGSTGKPKGVAIPHRPAVVLAHWAKQAFSDAERDGVLAATSICFDLSVFEILVTLAWGGKVILAKNALHLADHPAAAEVKLVNTVPSAIAELVRMQAIPPSVETVNLAGEALKRSLVDEVYALPGVGPLPGIGPHSGIGQIWNLYGPSEDTTYSTWYRVPRAERRAPAIGRPVDGSTAYVLDRALRPAAFGVPGELYLGGAGLSRGYHDRPGLTAERYLPDPFTAAKDRAAGGRMYRTGDLCRFLPDGQLDYLGRIDHQVKVRGFRIELGEVEAVLVRHHQVRAAVVVARERVPGELSLVGYVVPAAELDVEEVRRFAAGLLPDYMVPPLLVVLDELPLNANGKVDRKALPAPERPAAEEEGRVTPRTPTEETLARLFAEVLFGDGEAVERFGVHDSFFRLGGHSLTATRLVSRLREELGADLPLRAVFEAPTVAALASRIAGAAGALEGTAEPGPPLAAGPRPAELPLSFAQERLWFLDLFEPGNAAYNVPTALRLAGTLAPRALAACFAELARRHESLRTTFGSAGGRPSQRVATAMAFAVPAVDLSGLANAAAAAEAGRLRNAEAARPFDLARGPLLRATLVRLSAGEHHLLLDGHHIAVDGWSITLLVRELAALYGTFLEDRPSPLAPLPLQYADYALWQRRWLAGDELGRQLAYWRRKLAGAPQGLELPADWPRAAVRTYSSGSQQVTLPPELVARLTAIAERRNATLFMALLAGFKALLARLSGEADVVVGTPIAGRNRAALEGLVGMFLNTLVLRTDLSGRPSFETLIDRVRETALAAYAHQELPFEKLLDELKPERDLSRTPLFQVFFNLLNLPLVEARLPGLEIGLLAPPEVPSKFDLTVYAQPVDGGMKLQLVYNSELFSRARVAELARQLGGLLEALAADPAAEIGAVSLLTGEARAALPDPAAPLSDAWNGAIHELASRQALARPDRLAIQENGAAWTYGRLETESNRLAHRLIGLGVAAGDPVAIYAHRSGAVVWAVAGALKAGGAFAMLDPAYPEERLIQMLRLAKPRAVLRLTAAGPLPAGVERLLADELACPIVALPAIGDESPGGAFPDQAAWTPDVEVGPDSPACLGFTSGSTGVPKGVVGRHGPLTHFLPWQCRRFGLAAGDRFSLLSGLAHDPLQRDLFTPLFLGAAIAVPDPGEILVAGGAAAWMARQAVTVAHLTPAMGQVLTEPGAAGANEKLAHLRFVLLVGDVLTRRDAGRIRDLAPGVTVVNLYGSTETQRAVSYHVVDAPAGNGTRAPVSGGERTKQVLPCGAGMEDVQVLVLNRHGQLAGVGELGEIYMRSPHLAAGYLDDPELTAEKFLANPFAAPGGSAGDRLYRTGDLGRYLPDGQVVFVGRADKQVKVRGFRVELGEIEAAIGRLPGVVEAVALLRPAPAGDARLAAYVVAARSEAADAGAGIKEALRKRLPAYMVPASVILLDRLPLTPNGKVDREALKEMSDTKPDGRALEGPQTEAERIVLGLFRELLQVEHVGVEDNFFEMGGNSLLLVQLQSRLQQAFSRPVAMVDLFDHLTIRELARHLSPAEAPRQTTIDDEQWGERLKQGRNRLKQRSRALAGAVPATMKSGASDEPFGEP